MNKNKENKLKPSDKWYKKASEEEDKFDSIQVGTDLNAMRILGVHNTTSKKCWCNPKIIKPKTTEQI